MPKDIKTILVLIAGTLVLIIGFAIWQGGKSQHPNNGVIGAEVVGLTSNPESYDLGDVPINGGLVTKEYEVKNTTDKTLKLKKITTSCMCTTASVAIGENVTKPFGMEMTGDRNAPVNLDLPAGASAKVTVKFDPAAHGPTGTGPFDRIVWLTFSDPAGVEELKFSGRVIP